VGVEGAAVLPLVDAIVILSVQCWKASRRPSNVSVNVSSGSDRRHARSNPLRFAASAQQSAEHSHAPRPGAPRPMRTTPSAAIAHRTIDP